MSQTAGLGAYLLRNLSLEEGFSPHLKSIEGHRLNQHQIHQRGSAWALKGQPCSGLGLPEVDDRLDYRLSLVVEHGNRLTQRKWWLSSRLVIAVIFSGTRGCPCRSDGQAPFVPGVQAPC